MNSPFRAVTTPEKARLRVEDFLLLNDNGAFDKYSKTELIQGEIYFINAQHSRHARIKTQLAIELAICLRELSSEFEPIIEASTRISDDSLPEPDIVVTSYKGPSVVPLDTVALLIEVSDSTLDIDLGRKADLYANAGVPEYWVVDVNENRVLMHANPRGDGSGYDGQLDVPFGEPLHAATIAGLEVETAGLG
ncbi:Uma2 family endonuclease [Novosphingobium sp.]|uniref:Uma2 family endonuclease n=1 Tax=Novosphingobium sp. TaxID=1874826 RepID=UPI00286CAC8C|nr:Uma2 family endonuclease [Novosphingobium sp.]